MTLIEQSQKCIKFGLLQPNPNLSLPTLVILFLLSYIHSVGKHCKSIYLTFKVLTNMGSVWFLFCWYKLKQAKDGRNCAQCSLMCFQVLWLRDTKQTAAHEDWAVNYFCYKLIMRSNHLIVFYRQRTCYHVDMKSTRYLKQAPLSLPLHPLLLCWNTNDTRKLN